MKCINCNQTSKHVTTVKGYAVYQCKNPACSLQSWEVLDEEVEYK